MEVIPEVLADLQLVGDLHAAQPLVDLVEQLVPLTRRTTSIDLDHNIVLAAGQVGIPINVPAISDQLAAGAGIHMQNGGIPGDLILAKNRRQKQTDLGVISSRDHDREGLKLGHGRLGHFLL